MKRLKQFVIGFLVAAAGVAFAATFNQFSPATGILKGNASTYVTTAATSADIVATFSGTCNSSTALKGDGTCGAVTTTPAGSDTEVQYNNAGAFGASSRLAWNDTTRTLTVGGTSGFATIQGGSGATQFELIGPPRPAAGSGHDIGLRGGVPTDGNGGDIFISGANGVGTNRNGGNIDFQTGTPTGSGTAGEYTFTTGSSLRWRLLGNGEWNIGGSGGSSGQVLTSNGAGTAPTWQTNASGTVTSVGLTMPSGLSVVGSPVTTSGTLAVSTTLNGPLRGNGSGFITGTTALGSEVSGTLPVANGGTGTTTSTGSGSVVLSASPTLTGTVTAATIAATAVTVGGNNVCQSTGTNCPSSVTASSTSVATTLSNCSSGGGVTAYFYKVGQMVTMMMPGVTCTSAASTTAIGYTDLIPVGYKPNTSGGGGNRCFSTVHLNLVRQVPDLSVGSPGGALGNDDVTFGVSPNTTAGTSQTIAALVCNWFTDP